MTLGVELAQPWALLLLPLAVLPLLRQGRDTLTFSHLAWLPRDRLGQLAGFLWRALAVTAIASMAIALAGPGRPETQVTRTGYGAEIVVLVDRSRSMDQRMLPSDWRTIDALDLPYQARSRGPVKSQVARDLLADFVRQRLTDRFAVMFFSTNPLNVVSFTQHDEVVLAAIEAGGVGRGLGDTDVGRAMLAAIGEFEQRPYSGSRIILLVSDGGAHLDDATQRRIRAGMLRHRIALYWIYLRSFNSPTLDAQDRGSEAVPEIALHRFFQTLATPYQAYQAEIPEDLAKAVADVGKQQNLPLDFVERIPRKDYSRYFVAAAALACLLLLAYRSVLLRSWA